MGSDNTPRKRSDSETHCHCGSEYAGSDHCPECGCEQYESIIVRDCGHVHSKES